MYTNACISHIYTHTNIQIHVYTYKYTYLHIYITCIYTYITYITYTQVLEHLTRALDEKEDARRLAWVLAAIARPQLNCNNPGVCYKYNPIQTNPANLSNDSI
jgi:hypothetical protein